MNITRTNLKAKEWSLYSFISAEYYNFASKIYLWLAIMINLILYSLSAQPTSFSSTWLFPLVYAAPVRHTPGNYKEDPLGLAPKCLLGVFNPRHMDFMRHWKPLDRPPGVIKKKKFLPRKPWTFQLILFDIIPHWTYSVKPSQSKFLKILQTCLTALTLTTLLALSQIANLR